MWKPLLAILAAIVVSGDAMAAPPPRVLVSITPLHGLVASVMKGAGQPGLISANGSPHDHALKPSEMRAIEQAALVVWVGPGFEGWLARPLARKPPTSVLAMVGVAQMSLLPTREGGPWDHDDHDHDHAHEHGPDGHDETDGHLWLDPGNAERLVVAVADRLGALDPERAGLYRDNAALTVARIHDLDKTLAARLAPVARRPYVVFHDAHQYLERRYGLTPAGAMTVDPERPLAGRRLAQLRDRLRQSGAGCVFREPRFGESAARALAQSAGVRVAELDPEGTAVPPGPDAYFVTMERLGNALADCLSAR